MDKLIKGSLFICCVLWSFTLQAQDAATVSGEVIDITCYLTKGGQGAEHAGCAKACLSAGKPMGLLSDDGTLFLLGAGEDGAAYDALKELAGEMAEVTGAQSERSGMKMVVVAESKKAGS